MMTWKRSLFDSIVSGDTKKVSSTLSSPAHRLTPSILSDALVLAVSCRSPREDIVRNLISAGADVNLRTLGGRLPLIEATRAAVLAEEPLPILATLVNAGADVLAVDASGVSAAFVAARASLLPVLRLFGARAAGPCGDAPSPLHAAAYYGHVDAAALLVGAGADPLALTAAGVSARGLAVVSTHRPLLKVLGPGAGDELHVADQCSDVAMNYRIPTCSLPFYSGGCLFGVVGGAEPRLAKASFSNNLNLPKTCLDFIVATPILRDTPEGNTPLVYAGQTVRTRDKGGVFSFRACPKSGPHVIRYFPPKDPADNVAAACPSGGLWGLDACGPALARLPLGATPAELGRRRDIFGYSIIHHLVGLGQVELCARLLRSGAEYPAVCPRADAPDDDLPTPAAIAVTSLAPGEWAFLAPYVDGSHRLVAADGTVDVGGLMVEAPPSAETRELVWAALHAGVQSVPFAMAFDPLVMFTVSSQLDAWATDQERATLLAAMRQRFAPVFAPPHPALATRCYARVPPDTPLAHRVTIRSAAWTSLLQLPTIEEQSFRRLAEKARGGRSARDKIRNDVARTFKFNTNIDRDALFRVLSMFQASVGDSGVSYLQGMNVVCAVFTMVLPEPTALLAFQRHISAHVPTYTQNTLLGCHTAAAIAGRIVEHLDPELAASLTAQRYVPTVWAFPSLLTFCANRPPVPEVVRLWDFYLSYGFHYNVLAVTQLVLDRREEVLANQKLSIRQPLFQDSIMSKRPFTATQLIRDVCAMAERLAAEQPKLWHAVKTHAHDFDICHEIQ